MLFEQYEELILESKFSVMLFLQCDVLFHYIDIRETDRKHAITNLPGKVM
jgi:hypothetical protein